jgi:amino acid adenylation domain-containing protein
LNESANGLKECVQLSSSEAAAWPDTASQMAGPAISEDRCIHQLIEDQVERSPDAVAVLFERESLTYGELNRRANCLAHHLLALGAGPEIPVALFLERSLELAVAVLGLLKAGAVSVPLDTDFPRERLAFMLSDTHTRFIVTTSILLDKLSPHEACAVCLDWEADSIARRRDDNPVSGVTADNLCTYFYTSGSTGAPKAVMTTHRVASRIEWSHSNAVHIDERDRMLVTTSAGYGFFLGEFASGLMRGATAVLARPGAYRDVDYLVDMVEHQGITVIALVPSVLKHFLTRLKERGLAAGCGLRHVVSQGEALPADLQSDLTMSLNARIHRFYGMTEAPVAAYSSCDEAESGATTILGRPTDMEFRLLDSQLNPVPVGTRGEIYLSCPGMARGYLNRPGLTAERFVPNPFSTLPGSRLFRTGDIARWLPGGALEFLGRADRMVKVRGIRVDLGEIEAAVRRHPAAREAAVVVRDGPNAPHQLVAYVAPMPGAVLVPGELRDLVERVLPGSLIPNSFVVVPDLPKTAGGKVDYPALSSVGRGGSPRGPTESRSLSALEEKVAAVWASVLGVEKVGPHDDFFESGGDSLAVSRLAIALGEAFGGPIPLNLVFQAPTVAEMARRLGEDYSTTPAESGVRAGNPPAKRPFFCLSAGPVIARFLTDRPVFSLDISDVELVANRTIEEFAACYVRKLIERQGRGPYFLQAVSLRSVVALEMAQQLRAAGEEVALLVLFEPALLAKPERWRPSLEPDKVDTEREQQPMVRRPLAARVLDLLIAGCYREIVLKLRDRCRSRMNLILLSLPVLNRIRRITLNMRVLHARDSYRPRSYTGNVLAFFCPSFANSEVGKMSLVQWQRVCTQITLSHSSGLGFPHDGGHFMLFEEQHTRSLFAKLSEYLDQLENGEVGADDIVTDRSTWERVAC